MPKGKIIVIGGAESKGEERDLYRAEENKDFVPFEILRELIPLKNEANKTIEIITSASTIPLEIEKMYRKAYEQIGFRSIGFIHTEQRKECENEKYIERVKKAHCVFFSGGDQFRLVYIMSATPLLDVIKARFYNDEQFVVAGTSAGAMALSVLMLERGARTEALIKGEVSIGAGFGFIDGVIFDTHFIRRGRIGRLGHAVIHNPEYLGIGIGEDTALIINNQNEARCIGSGMVIIIDGKRITYSNILEADYNSALCVENLTLHILAKGFAYQLKERKFINIKELQET